MRALPWADKHEEIHCTSCYRLSNHSIRRPPAFLPPWLSQKAPVFPRRNTAASKSHISPTASLFFFKSEFPELNISVAMLGFYIAMFFFSFSSPYSNADSHTCTLTFINYITNEKMYAIAFFLEFNCMISAFSVCCSFQNLNKVSSEIFIIGTLCLMSQNLPFKTPDENILRRQLTSHFLRCNPASILLCQNTQIQSSRSEF